MNVLVAILGLAFLVFVHEAGHFVTARLVGMRPRRFYIGFPPPLVRIRRKGIEYGIGAIPLGGYVDIPGMHRPAPADVDAHFGRAVREDPNLTGPSERLKRALGATDFEHAKEELEELGAEIEAAELSPEAKRPAERGLRRIGDALAPDAYWRQRTWKKIVVIFAGPGTNLVFAIVLFAILFMLSGRVSPTVAEVIPNHPAAIVGLHPGDRIVEINGKPVAPEKIRATIQASHGKPVTLEVVRNGRLVTIGPVRPKKEGGSYLLGFVLQGRGESVGPAFADSFRVTGQVVKGFGTTIADLVRGHNRKDLSSTVGIVQVSSQAAKQGAEQYLWVLGLISLSLALLNLLPLLPLDGGHIAFSIVEGIRKRPVAREVYERVSALGIALFLFLFIIGLSNDINRLGGG